jgi:hypothetical protein
MVGAVAVVGTAAVKANRQSQHKYHKHPRARRIARGCVDLIGHREQPPVPLLSQSSIEYICKTWTTNDASARN